MTVAYVRSTDGSDADDGLSWANAEANITAGVTTAGATSNRCWISDNHAQSGASSITITPGGTADSPTEILCGDDSAEPPTSLMNTATVTVTGASNITFSTGFAHIYGITFNAGSSTSSGTILFSSTSPWGYSLEACKLKLLGTGSGGLIGIGAGANGDDQYLNLLNCEFNSAAAAHHLSFKSCRFEMVGGTLTGTSPTALCKTTSSAGNGVTAKFNGVDLSIAAGALVDVSGGGTGDFEFYGCLLHASNTIVTGTRPSAGGLNVLVVGSANFYFYDCYAGRITNEATIVRTSGASDGTLSHSRKMVSTANCKWTLPFHDHENQWMSKWNDVIGSAQTITVEIVNDNNTLTDAQVHLEILHLGTASSNLLSNARDRAATIVTTPANQTSSSVAWTTTGLTTPIKQKLEVTFTAQVKGYVYARVVVTTPSMTLYYDPKMTIA